YMLALAQCWNLLAGYAGLISVGQQAFVGLGGYLLFPLAQLGGIDPLLAIPIPGIGSAAFSLPTPFIVFRLRGARFSVGTWVGADFLASGAGGVAEVSGLVFAHFKDLGGAPAPSVAPSATSAVWGIEWVRAWFDVRPPAARDIISYWVALLLVTGTLALVYLI